MHVCVEKCSIAVQRDELYTLCVMVHRANAQSSKCVSQYICDTCYDAIYLCSGWTYLILAILLLTVIEVPNCCITSQRHLQGSLLNRLWAQHASTARDLYEAAASVCRRRASESRLSSPSQHLRAEAGRAPVEHRARQALEVSRIIDNNRTLKFRSPAGTTRS
jgi:hypothetical protein